MMQVGAPDFVELMRQIKEKNIQSRSASNEKNIDLMITSFMRDTVKAHALNNVLTNLNSPNSIERKKAQDIYDSIDTDKLKQLALPSLATNREVLPENVWLTRSQGKKGKVYAPVIPSLTDFFKPAFTFNTEEITTSNLNFVNILLLIVFDKQLASIGKTDEDNLMKEWFAEAKKIDDDYEAFGLSANADFIVKLYVLVKSIFTALAKNSNNELTFAELIKQAKPFVFGLYDAALHGGAHRG